MDNQIYSFIIFFLINIILIIITHILLNNNLDNLISYCKAYVDNITNKEFKQLRKIFLNKEKNNLIIKKYNKNFNRFKNEIIFNSPPKKHSLKNYLNSNRHSTILNINNTIKSKDNIDKIIIKNDDNIKYDVIGFFQKECFTNESKHSSHTTEKKEKIYKRSLKNNKNVIKINQNEDNIKEIKRKEEVVNHNYYEYLIFSFPKKERNLFLIEEELNYLDFSYYRHIESRKWYKIFWSIFKINYDFTNTFFIYNYKDYNDYQIYTIKIMIYVNSVIISILVNIMLYNSETINRIYENKKYNILSRLRIIFISDLAMKFIPILFRYLISYQSILIELKINLNETNKIVKEKNKNDFNNIQNINSSFNTEERLNDDINIKNQDNENYKEIEGEKIKKSVNRNIIIFYIIIII